MLDKIIVLDFGGQYNQLIARRVREMGVYCEILPYSAPTELWADDKSQGHDSHRRAQQRLRSGCASRGRRDLRPGRAGAGDLLRNAIDQLHSSGVRSSTRRSANTATPMLCVDPARFSRACAGNRGVYESHRSRGQVARGISLRRAHANIARWPHSPASQTGIYGVQFHPEVRHTVEGARFCEILSLACAAARAIIARRTGSKRCCAKFALRWATGRWSQACPAVWIRRWPVRWPAGRFKRNS